MQDILVRSKSVVFVVVAGPVYVVQGFLGSRLMSDYAVYDLVGGFVLHGGLCNTVMERIVSLHSTCFSVDVIDVLRSVYFVYFSV